MTAKEALSEKKEGVHIEQSAKGGWVKSEGWDCIGDELQTSR